MYTYSFEKLIVWERSVFLVKSIYTYQILCKDLEFLKSQEYLQLRALINETANKLTDLLKVNSNQLINSTIPQRCL